MPPACYATHNPTSFKTGGPFVVFWKFLVFACEEQLFAVSYLLQELQ